MTEHKHHVIESLCLDISHLEFTDINDLKSAILNHPVYSKKSQFQICFERYLMVSIKTWFLIMTNGGNDYDMEEKRFMKFKLAPIN